jgi:DNA recombination protein RmuC
MWVLLRQNGSGRQQRDVAFSLLQNQVTSGLGQSAQQMDSLRKSVSDAITALSQQVATSMRDSNKTIQERLDGTQKVVGDVRQQLGQLEESSRQMLAIGKDISSLEMILRPPKLRGGLGELFLADLLAQILPPDHYQLQYRFKGGETVDAVIMLRLGMVPIDAKFPLENFRRILEADTAEARKGPKRAFIKDVKGHIDTISRKYIRMDENTFDFALMYIPAENVYYETIIKDDAFGGDMSLFSYALEKRVIPVSPNSFYAYLQTIILGLQGMRIEARSREVIENLARLNKEFERFSDAFRLVGQHMDNSMKKYAEAEKRFGKVEGKLAQIDGLAKGLEEPPQSVPLEQGSDQQRG